MSVMPNPLSSPDASIGLSSGLGHHSLRMPTNSRRAGPATARFCQGSHGPIASLAEGTKAPPGGLCAMYCPTPPLITKHVYTSHVIKARQAKHIANKLSIITLCRKNHNNGSPAKYRVYTELSQIQ